MSDREGPGARSKPPLCVVVLDTLRADMADPPYLVSGLPALQRMFNESLVFTRAYAPSHWTLPSHASLFTGLAPSEHLACPPHMKLRADVPTLAEVLRDEGYDTVCITCNPWISEIADMTRGFNSVWMPGYKGRGLLETVFRSFRRRLEVSDGVAPVLADLGFRAAALIMSSPLMDNGARAAIRRARRRLRAGNGVPFLLLNLMETHTPYYGRGRFAPWRRRIQTAGIFRGWGDLTYGVMGGLRALTPEVRHAIEAIYWENARYLDGQIAALLEGLPEAFLTDGYLVFVSDHGQLLGERGGLDHMAGLSEELIRVPLAIRPPGGIEGRRIERPMDISALFSLLTAIASSTEDAFPRWLDELSETEFVVSEAQSGGIPLIAGPRRRDDLLRRKDVQAFKARHDHPALACVKGPWKLICHLGRREDELYNVVKDMGQKENRVAEKPDVSEDLHEKLRERYQRRFRALPRSVRHDRLPLNAKRSIARAVLRDALTLDREPVLVWTAGKDSTLVLYLALELARQEGLEMPALLFIDHGQHFPETWSLIKEIAEQEKLDLLVARNEDLLAQAGDYGESVLLEALDAENQEEALRAGLEGTKVPLSLDTPVGNHLLKTVALNLAIRDRRIDTVIAGIRWDENPARACEVFFSPRENPPHMRVHPILPWTEREVWTYTLEHGLPIHPLYRQGYRSFDGVRDSSPTDARPAWEQDLEGSEERLGRAQDKEEIMERLRALGYF